MRDIAFAPTVAEWNACSCGCHHVNVVFAWTQFVAVGHDQTRITMHAQPLYRAFVLSLN